ncbi:hypothetical protein H0V99_03545 [Candidatus Saccharibacteria bacterium]|nr:hypothetical protein [Candidatus Saccharibacteria bacterium]
MVTPHEMSVSAVGTVFDPIRPDYADFSIDVGDSFNWPGILSNLEIKIGKQVAFYAFRSELKPDADPAVLAALDEKALIAAENANGFIYYQPLNRLSFCLWESTLDAKVATSSPEHREAAKYVDKAYKRWELVRRMVARTAVNQVEFTEVVK